jgi:hypothetical protein
LSWAAAGAAPDAIMARAKMDIRAARRIMIVSNFARK